MKGECVALCSVRGFAFRHQHIERDMQSLEDVYDFIAFMNVIADTYAPLDDLE